MRIPKNVLAVAIGAASILATFAGDRPVDGAWHLIEQRYERGDANLAERVEIQHLDISGSITGPQVRTWIGDEASAAVAWPAVIVGGRAIEIVVRERTVDRTAGMLRAAYVVDPGVDGGQRVEIVEEYRYDPATDALVGTVELAMIRADGSRGGYVLHRRFARAR